LQNQQLQTLLHQGIAAAKAGQKDQARQFLLRVIEDDESNVQAWLWLSSVVDDPVEKFTCLHNVLQLEPDNQPAQLGLARLNSSSSRLPPAPVTRPPLVEPETPSSSKIEPPPPNPALSTSRYKRLAPRLVPKEVPPDFSADAPASPDEKPESSDQVEGLRYRRSLRDNQELTSTSARPGHLAEYASMASALIQKKSGGADEIGERRGGAQCPFCHCSISVMAVECDHCRLPLVVNCPVCDTRLDVELSACPSCGQPMGTYKDKPGYFANLAAAYQGQHKQKNAEATWEIVQVLSPDYPDLHLRLAQAQVGADRPNKAIQTLRLVLESEPGQEAASVALGQIYHKLSYWNEAEEIYREALAVTTDSAELNYGLGWLLADYGQIKQGFVYISRATELDPGHGPAWFRLGQVYNALHKPKQAADAYRRAAVCLPVGTLAYQKALHITSKLEVDLPHVLSTGWSEFMRQATGPFLVCVVAVLLDSGLRPWWISLPGWGALLVGLLGTVLWVSGFSLPRNPVICWLMGQQGLTDSASRMLATMIGGFLWLLAMVIILYPINQTIPKVPEWILNS
jgi:tetratricopeptide (TPR) repeat protein